MVSSCTYYRHNSSKQSLTRARETLRVSIFMCYLLYLRAIGEDVELLQNSHSKLLRIQGVPHNRLHCVPMLWLHTWVAQIGDHRQLKENI